MGSGSNRKVTDRPIIRIPSTGSGVGSSSGNEAANTCLPSFDVKLEDVKIKDGTKSLLSKSGDLYEIKVNLKVVGQLSPRLSQMVRNCLATGIGYSGETIAIKNVTYARFTRTSS
jgi:hypothetical protein